MCIKINQLSFSQWLAKNSDRFNELGDAFYAIDVEKDVILYTNTDEKLFTEYLMSLSPEFVRSLQTGHTSYYKH